jgi:broad specificity phosphatase PhoE
MGMPIDLVLVRHGESEGNLATALSKRGDDSMFTLDFLNRHSATWKLTEKGKQQAAIAGQWIKENISKVFYRYYVSDYDRAKQTAALMGFSDAEWLKTYYLIERNWGELDVMPFEKRKNDFAENLRKKEIDPFYWSPTNGESMPALFLRLEKILETLHRECERQAVLLVVHGEVMWGLRYLLERMTHSQIMEFEYSKNPHDKIHNCQVIHYTRQNPVSGEITPYLNWMRSVCPTDFSLSNNQWQRIVRRKFSNEELLEQVALRHDGYL